MIIGLPSTSVRVDVEWRWAVVNPSGLQRFGGWRTSQFQQITTTCGRAFGIAEADKPARFSQRITGQALWRIEPFKV